MPTRYRLEGSIFYITSNIYDRLCIFKMPDHLHLLIWPQAEEAVTDFMRDFKRFTSGRIARQAKVNYIHLNPVRAGIADTAENYPYPSYRNYYLGDHHLIEIDTEWN